MNKMQRQIKLAKKKGLSPLQIAQMQAIAKSNATAMQEEAVWQAFQLMLCVSANVLGGMYWQKTARRKVPEYIENVIELYDAIRCGAVSWDEIKEVAEQYGFKFEGDKIIDTRKAKK